MQLVIKGLFNKYFKPVNEGGLGVPDIILGLFTEDRVYTNNEIYELIQLSGENSEVKSIPKSGIKDIINEMININYLSGNGESIGLAANESITYTQVDSFGCESKYDVDGVDNGSTRTISLEGWKPDGSQIRWGFVTVTHPDAAFSAINAILGTFTGRKGETYNLLLSCLIGGEWKTKTFDIRFNS